MMLLKQIKFYLLLFGGLKWSITYENISLSPLASLPPIRSETSPLLFDCTRWRLIVERVVSNASFCCLCCCCCERGFNGCWWLLRWFCWREFGRLPIGCSLILLLLLLLLFRCLGIGSGRLLLVLSIDSWLIRSSTNTLFFPPPSTLFPLFLCLDLLWNFLLKD